MFKQEWRKLKGRVTLIEKEKLFPFFGVLILIIGFNICVYRYLLFCQRANDLLLIQGYKQGIEQILSYDLQSALAPNGAENRTFFLFKDKALANNKNTNSNVLNYQLTVTGYAIFIESLTGNWIFDLQRFREMLDKIVPSYILYRIDINKNNIALSKNYKQSLKTNGDYELKNSANVAIELGIDTNSDYYKNSAYKIYKILLFSVFISNLISFISLAAYLRFKQKRRQVLEELEEELSQQKKLNKALLESKKMEQSLKLLFIKKATEMLVLQNSVEHKEEAIKQLQPENYLFPITLNDPSEGKILLSELKDHLYSFFGCHFEQVVLRVESSYNDIVVDCAKEVFLQLTFSLIYNLIIFMENQSDTPKAIVIEIYRNKIVLNYDSFPLNEEKMVNLSNKLLSDYIDPFLLNCERIFGSLHLHGLKYELSNCNGVNIIEICTRKESINLNTCSQVIKFKQGKSYGASK